MEDRKSMALYVVILVLSVILFLALIYPKFFATIDTKVYFANQQAQYLVAKKREVKKNDLYKNLIQELIVGPNSDKTTRTIPPQTKLLGIKVEDKVAKVDFSQEFKEKHWGGTAGETMTVYSVVNTLTQFNAIDKVQILITGEEIKTLAGHMDLKQPLRFNSQIIKSE